MKSILTLSEWAGGKEQFEKLTKLFYANVLKDNLPAPVFKNMSAEHTKHVAHFIAEVFSGEKFYTEGDKGSHAKMIADHFNKILNENQRNRWMQFFLEAADDIGLANDPEFRLALVSYLEWGSRIAVINSNTTTSTIEEDAPMPKWDGEKQVTKIETSKDIFTTALINLNLITSFL